MINKIRLNAGMTYIELIVVLSILAMLTSVVTFNYKEFNDKVELRNSIDGLALKIVEAQKTALAGKILKEGMNGVTSEEDWKPSYGLYFNLGNKNNYIYFIDNENDSKYSKSDITCDKDVDCLEKITLGNNNSIESIQNCISETSCAGVNNLTIVFTRPNFKAELFYNDSSNTKTDIESPNYVKINLTTQRGSNTFINVYPSGRVQVK